MQINSSYIPKLYSQMLTQSEELNLQELKPGDLFKGMVQDIEGNKILLKLLSGEKLLATKDSSMTVKEGQLLQFEVKSTSKGQIHIRPNMTEDSGNRGMAHQALSHAGLPLNDKNLGLVLKLMEAKLPINKETIQQVFQEQKGLPLEKVLFFLKNNLQVSDKNVDLLDQVLGYKEPLTDKLANFVQNLREIPPKASQALFDTLVKDEQVPLDTLKEMITTSLPKGIAIPKLKSASTLQEVKELVSRELETLEPKVLQSVQKNVLTKFLSKTLFVQAQDKEESIPSTYKAIVDTIKGSQQVMEQLQDTSLDHELNGLQEHLQMMEQVSEDLTMLNLPLQFNNGLVQGNLIYFEGKGAKGSGQETGAKTALISLDTAHLGQFECYISLNDQQLGLDMGVETPYLVELINRHLTPLKVALNQQGYQLAHLNVRHVEENFDFFNSHEKDSGTSSQPKQESFDVKV